MSAPITERGTIKSWMRRDFLEGVEIKEEKKNSCSVSHRPVICMPPGPTFLETTAESHATPEPHAFVCRAETGVTTRPGQASSTSNTENARSTVPRCDTLIIP